MSNKMILNIIKGEKESVFDYEELKCLTWYINIRKLYDVTKYWNHNKVYIVKLFVYYNLSDLYVPMFR